MSLRARIVSLDMRQWREFVRIFGMEEPMVKRKSNGVVDDDDDDGVVVVDDADDGGEGSDNTVENILHVSVE